MRVKQLLRGVALFLPAVVGVAAFGVAVAALLVPSVMVALGIEGLIAVVGVGSGGTVGFATVGDRLRRLSREVVAADSAGYASGERERRGQTDSTG